MKIAPFIDPDGIACDRERAAYRAELITERDRFLIAFLPMAEDGLTYLERVSAAAPYIHPRLSSTQIGATIKRDITELTRDELVAIIASKSCC